MAARRHAPLLHVMCGFAGRRPCLSVLDLSRFLVRFSVRFPDSLLPIDQAAAGVLHLHSQTPPIVHRDLATRNLLLDEHMHLVCFHTSHRTPFDDFFQCTF